MSLAQTVSIQTVTITTMQPNADSQIRIKTTQIWDIPGGVHPSENKAQSLTQPIGDAPIPSEVILPLGMHIGAPSEPVVAVGDRVLTGQLVAKPQGFVSGSVHASISGTVTAIEDRPLAHASGMYGPAIVIESDGLDETIEFEPIEDYRSHQPAELVERLRQSGLAGMGGAGFPTSVKLSPKDTIDTLILNGTECEPYITADHALMREKANEIIQGSILLAYILGEPKQILIGIEDNKPDAVEIMESAAKKLGDTRVQVVSFPTKYPSGGEKQLIQILTGKEVESGQLPANLGIVVQNLGTAVAALEAVSIGKPLISRVTTMVGEALNNQQNLNVRIGTPVQALLDFCGYNQDKADRIVMGGPMMGFSLLNSQAPVVKTTNCLLVPTATELPPPPPAQACIRCGLCAEACPASLLPQQLLWYAQAQDEEKLKDYHLFDCIECGACAYVCPSSIPLVQYYRAAKGDIRQAEKEKVKSDQARIRFETRQERLLKEAEEREAKRKTRMAAAKAKQAKAAANKVTPANGESPVGGESQEGSASDLVAQAMARVNQAKQSPEDERAKLERQKQTFEDRILSVRAKMESAETDELKAKFSSQLKNTENKLQGILSKLVELNAPSSEAEVTAKPASEPEADAAGDAIERAKKRAAEMASMPENEKLQTALDSLLKRKGKAEQKLVEAEEAGADTVDALRTGLEKINEKITATEAELKASR